MVTAASLKYCSMEKMRQNKCLQSKYEWISSNPEVTWKMSLPLGVACRSSNSPTWSSTMISVIRVVYISLQHLGDGNHLITSTFWPQPLWQMACQACLLILSWDFGNQSENIRRLLHGTNYHLEEMCSRSQKGNLRSFYWLTTPIRLASFVLKIGWIQLSS